MSASAAYVTQKCPHADDASVLTLLHCSQIPDMKAQLRLPPPHSHDAIMATSQCFDICQHGAFYALDSLGAKFAVLNKKVCQDIKALLAGRDLRLQAYVSREEWTHTGQQWEREKAAAVVNFDLNIYGSRKDANDVGKILSSAMLFLQRPLYGIGGNVVYYNPHYLHAEEIRGNEVSETPISIAQDKPSDSHGDAEGQAKKAVQDEVDQTSDTGEIDTILNSLSHHNILAKSATDRSIIKSTLIECV